MQHIIHLGNGRIVKPQRVAKHLGIVTIEARHGLELRMRHITEVSQICRFLTFASGCTSRCRCRGTWSTCRNDSATKSTALITPSVSKAAPLEGQQTIQHINANASSFHNGTKCSTETCSSCHDTCNLECTAKARQTRCNIVHHTCFS